MDIDGAPRPFNATYRPFTDGYGRLGTPAYRAFHYPSVSINAYGTGGLPDASRVYSYSGERRRLAYLPVESQWQRCGNQQPTFSTLNLNTGDVVSCTMTSSDPCANPVLAPAIPFR